jgi:hypothetical protein
MNLSLIGFRVEKDSAQGLRRDRPRVLILEKIQEIKYLVLDFMEQNEGPPDNCLGSRGSPS